MSPDLHMRAGEVEFGMVNGAGYFVTPTTERLHITPGDHALWLRAGDALVGIYGGTGELRALAERLAKSLGLEVAEPAPAPHQIDLDRIADLVQAKFAERGVGGTPAFVEQTGGGCATLYVGQYYEIDVPQYHPFEQEPTYVKQTCTPVMAGPGWFEGPSWTGGRASLDDFGIGVDDLWDESAKAAVAHLFEQGCRNGQTYAEMLEGGLTMPEVEDKVAEDIVTLWFAHPHGGRDV